MKKLTGLVAVAALVTLLPATPALAEGATVIESTGCGGFIPDENGGIQQFLSGTLHSVTTAKGNTSLMCKFTFEAGLIPNARRASGFPCGTYLGLTSDSKMVATPDGSGTLSCKINGSSN